MAAESKSAASAAFVIYFFLAILVQISNKWHTGADIVSVLPPKLDVTLTSGTTHHCNQSVTQSTFIYRALNYSQRRLEAFCAIKKQTNGNNPPERARGEKLPREKKPRADRNPGGRPPASTGWCEKRK